MPNIDQTEKITELLARIAKAESYKAGAWGRVVAEAKKYAMMKSLGKYVEKNSNGVECFISVNFSNRESYENIFAENVLRYAMDAMAEEAVGI